MDNQWGNHNSPDVATWWDGRLLFVCSCGCVSTFAAEWWELRKTSSHNQKRYTVIMLGWVQHPNSAIYNFAGCPWSKGREGREGEYFWAADRLPACLCPGAWWGRSVLCPGHSLLCYLPPTPSSPDCEYLFKQIHPMGWRSGLLASHCSSANPARWLEAICLGTKWRGSLM